jgi:hypothetical protein
MTMTALRPIRRHWAPTPVAFSRIWSLVTRTTVNFTEATGPRSEASGAASMVDAVPAGRKDAGRKDRSM